MGRGSEGVGRDGRLIDLANIARLLALLDEDGANVQAIFITLDPTRGPQELTSKINIIPEIRVS
ncbi:MAG: hypothetical protein WCG12_10090 [Alcaligenaceae bacterium]